MHVLVSCVLFWRFIQTSVFLKWDLQIQSNHLLFAVQSMIQWRSSGFSHERGVHEFVYFVFDLEITLTRYFVSKHAHNHHNHFLLLFWQDGDICQPWWKMYQYDRELIVALNIDLVPSSTNHCCPLLTQYMTSSPRNTQSSQMNLVCSCFDTMMIFVSLGWTSRD